MAIVGQPVLDALIRGLFLTAVGMAWVVLLVRINGLRSFSKMTSFDFVMTVAVGSLLAGVSQSTTWRATVQSISAMAALFLVQYLTARLRKATDSFEAVTQNKPIILMQDGKMLEEALTETRVTKSDLIAKLRESNVLDFAEVRAVILETTGDISVLHGETCSEDLLQGTKYVDR